MKKTLYLAAAAVLLMASTAAHAGGISFEIDGQRIHIDAPRNCSSLSCISVTNNGAAVNMRKLTPKGKKSDDDDDVASTPPAKQAPAAPAPAAAPVAKSAPTAPVANNAPPAPPAPPAPAAPATTYAPPAATTYAAPAATPAPAADASRERLSGLSSPTTRATPDATSANPPSVANAAPASQSPVATAPPAAQTGNNPPPLPADAAAAPNSPVGLWQTADNKGNVRIEQCGANLCGFAEKSNERILINMKPSGEKWTGRIHDPDSGSNYDSIIALKGPNLLKVQGCAFGGLFCGGQTWKRIS